MQKYFFKTILLMVLIIFPISIVSAEKAQIKGTIVASDNNKPLQSATITLRNAKDSSIVSGAISDNQGNFTITASEGNYFVEVKFVGYETAIVSDVNVRASQTKNLNIVKLNLTEVMQNEITVEAEKEFVEIGIDSRKYNITKDITAGGSNVLDVLRKLPSVEVDMEDNVKMNGTTPKILINGRESPMSEKNMLKVLSSELVESVELITNPSAKYESEGVSGIIDIVLKKQTGRGLNAMVTGGLGQDFQFKYGGNENLGLNANYNAGKLNLFARINYYNKDDKNGFVNAIFKT
jgi:hypothetical protein